MDMMKQLKPLLIALPAVVFLTGFVWFAKPGSKTPEENYANHCAGCHGIEYKTFTARQWTYTKSPEDMQRVIREGLADYGMPGFEGLFTEQEVSELSDLLWKESIRHQDDSGQKDKGQVIQSEAQRFRVDTVIAGLDVPWGIEFLPGGDLLITERSGKLLRLDNQGHLSEISGLPPIFVKGQGGLLEVKLHPNHRENGWIYFAYSYPDDQDGKTGNTAIMRAKLNQNSLSNQEIIFKGTPLSSSGVHFGSEIVFDPQGYLYFSIGERGNSANAQTLENHSGKIHRIFDDGRIPEDNPFVNTPGAMPTIYSYGHRNPQGLALHPETGKVWVHEHGPKGGDEINIIEKGKNYGWPEITYGINYNGTIITEDTAKVGMEQPFLYWVPSIAPCGLCFVTSDRYPGWKGDLLAGSLSFTYLHRVDLAGSELVAQEKLLPGIGRVRDIEESPDGYLYVAVERPGMLLKLMPVK